MTNINQNNENEHINKEISLLQDWLKINKKSLNQFQNGLTQIVRLRVKQGQRTNLLKPKKYNKYWRIYSTIRLSISKKDDLLRNALVNVKKKKEIIWKRIKENSKNAESFTKWI